MKKTKWLAILIVSTILYTGCGTNEGNTGAAKGDFPTKDVTVIVPYGAGGTTDLCVRGVLDAVDKTKFNHNFIVSNVTGGSGLIGATQMIHAKPDGYTLGVLNCDLVLNSVNGSTQLTPEQFTPIVCIENDPYLLLVRRDAPYQDFKSFVAYVKEHPGAIQVADTGMGSAPHLAYLALVQRLGLDLKSISYDSAADSVIAVVSGECQAVITASGAAIGQLKSDAVTAIAVTSNQRLGTFEQVPAMGELFDERCRD